MKATLSAWKRFEKVKLLKKITVKLRFGKIKDWGEHKSLEGLCPKTVPQMSKLSSHLKETETGSSIGDHSLCKRENGELQSQDPDSNT